MRILVINYEYPPVGAGGGEVSKFLAEGYAKRGHKVVVLTAHWNALRKREKVNDGLFIRRVFAFRKVADHCSPTQMAAFTVMAIPSALRLTGKWRPDVLHCHFAVPVSPVGYFANLIYKTPFIVTLHGGDVPGHQPEQTGKYFKLIKGAVTHILKRAYRCVAVSHRLAEQAMQGYHIHNVITIPNGVDVEAFHPWKSREKKGVVKGIFAGRFSKEKNLESLIDAVAMLVRGNVIDFRLKLVGAGPTEALIRKRIQNYGLRKYVRLTGWLPRETVAEELRESDIFILPSRIEGMPIACLQAMASGLAIVGSRTMGIEEVVRDGENGILVEVGNVQGLADAMERLIKNRGLLSMMGKRSREIAYEDFRWDVIVERYLNLFGEIIKRG